jgi:hypothetical protein
MPALELKFFDQCCNEPPKPWLFKGVIALDEDSSWYGPAGGGKSMALTDVAVHAAAEKDWRGFKNKVRAGVVYFAFERAGLTRRRLAAYAKRDNLKSLPIAVAEDIIDLVSDHCVETIFLTIKAAEERFGVPVLLIVIDTWAKGVAAGGGDEDKAQHVNAVAANLKRVHQEVSEKLKHMIHIATIGHSGKEEGKGERGSSAKKGHVDVEFQISGQCSTKTIKVTKGNDQAEDVLTAFEAEQVTLGTDPDGDPMTAAILSATKVTASQAASKLTNRQSNALVILRTLGGVAEADKWREELFRRGLLDRNAKNPRQPFWRLKNELMAIGQIVEQDGVVRLAADGMPVVTAAPSIMPGVNSNVISPPPVGIIPSMPPVPARPIVPTL